MGQALRHTGPARVSRGRSAPLREVLEGLADEAFAVVGNRPRYVRGGVERLQANLRQFPQYANVVVTKADLLVTSGEAEEATEAMSALKQELQALLPDAELTLRLHWLALKAVSSFPRLTQFGVLVSRTLGPFTLRREFLAAGTPPP
jgi:hypothetical protein